jgi:hypothetical protein
MVAFIRVSENDLNQLTTGPVNANEVDLPIQESRPLDKRQYERSAK